MRLIDPKMSIDTIKSYIEVWDCKGCLPYGETQHNVMAVDDLEYLPTIEADPVRHGRWIEVTKHRDENGTILTDYECSECCAMVKDSYPEEIESERFCYNCGARMDGGADNG